MIEKGTFRDQVMLMNVINHYKIDAQKMWEQIENQFSDTFLKQQVTS